MAAGRAPVEVLLVEDNEVNRLVAEQLLMQLGVRFAVAEDGAAAVARHRELAPAVILMDVSMPVMNGYEATRRIRAQEAEEGLERTAIIGLTAHAMQGDRERCLAAGMDDYMPKPISLEKLRTMLAEWRPAPQHAPAGPTARAAAVP